MAQAATKEECPPREPFQELVLERSSAVSSSQDKPNMMSVCTSSGAEEDPLLVNGEESNDDGEGVEEADEASPAAWGSKPKEDFIQQGAFPHQTTTTATDILTEEAGEVAAGPVPHTQGRDEFDKKRSFERPTATWVRVIAMVYFVSVTVSLSVISTTCLLGVIGAYKTLELIGTLANEGEDSKRRRLCRRENTVGLLIDLFVRSIMKASSWIFDVKVLGDGSPVDKMSREELTTWISMNRETRDGVDFCKIPRRPSDNRLRLPGACMVMCNHMSNIDGFALKSSLFPSVSKAIIKSEVKYVPFIGWTVALSGQPLVHFTGEKGGWGITRKEELVDRCKEVIDRNFPLLVYPEGVRRRFGRMAPFRYGMFNLAIENGYPILPSVIHGSQEAWPVSSPLVDFATIYLKFSDELILPKKGDSPDAVIAAVRSRMLQLLEGIPGYDATLEAPIVNYQEYKQLERAEQDESRKKR